MRLPPFLARLFRRPTPGAILAMDPIEEELLQRHRIARKAEPYPLSRRAKSTAFTVVPLDDRIVEGRYYIVTTRVGELFHVAMRRNGEWRYSPTSPVIEGEVTGYCPADGPAASGAE